MLCLFLLKPDKQKAAATSAFKMESALVGTSTSLGLRAGGIASLSILNGLPCEE